MLGQNEATRGFLFFRVPDGTPGFDQATLVLDLPADGAEISSIKVVVTQGCSVL